MTPFGTKKNKKKIFWKNTHKKNIKHTIKKNRIIKNRRKKKHKAYNFKKRIIKNWKKKTTWWVKSYQHLLSAENLILLKRLIRQGERDALKPKADQELNKTRRKRSAKTKGTPRWVPWRNSSLTDKNYRLRTLNRRTFTIYILPFSCSYRTLLTSLQQQK